MHGGVHGARRSVCLARRRTLTPTFGLSLGRTRKQNFSNAPIRAQQTAPGAPGYLVSPSPDKHVCRTSRSQNWEPRGAVIWVRGSALAGLGALVSRLLLIAPLFWRKRKCQRSRWEPVQTPAGSAGPQQNLGSGGRVRLRVRLHTLTRAEEEEEPNIWIRAGASYLREEVVHVRPSSTSGPLARFRRTLNALRSRTGTRSQRMMVGGRRGRSAERKLLFVP